MPKFHFELTSTPITSHVGLAFVGQALAEKKLVNHLASVCPKRRNGGFGGRAVCGPEWPVPVRRSGQRGCLLDLAGLEG